MGAFSFKKKKKLHKRAPLPEKPQGYRVPWSDDMSPLKIRFEDCDKHRAGMKFTRLQMDDRSIRTAIISDDFYGSFIGDAPQTLIDAIAADYAANNPEKPEFPHDDMRLNIKEGLESLNKGKVIVPKPEPEGFWSVDLMPTSWVGMLHLDMYVRANRVEMWLDPEADLVISGYDLYHRGILDKDSHIKYDQLTPSPENRQEFADIFELLEHGNAFREANKQAQSRMMLVYEDYLTEYGGPDHPYPDFKGHVEHNLRAVRRWMAEQIIGDIPSGASVVYADPVTGAVETIIGDDVTDDLLGKHGKDFQKQVEASRKRVA